MSAAYNLGDLFDPSSMGDRVALIDCRDWENPHTLTHGDIDRQVNACARALMARGLARGQRHRLLKNLLFLFHRFAG